MAKDPICGMDVKEAGSLNITHKGSTYYFCSQNCFKKFAAKHNIAEAEASECLSCRGISWYKNKLFIISAVLIALVSVSYVAPFLVPFRKALFMYLGRIWWAILLGFALGGVIDYFVPREYVSHILSKPKKRTIFYSVILGFFMSACSHGILALSMELHKKGASNPAVVAFLLASPWANLPLTIMLIGFFGFKGLYFVFGALVIAIITGLIFQFLDSKSLIEKNNNTTGSQEGFSVLKDMRVRRASYSFSAAQLLKDIRGIFSGSVNLANMVLWWILIGMGLAGLAAAYVPEGFLQAYMGPTILGLFITLVVATILEVCSEGTAPLAFEIYRQTQALGNAFVFLMAGVVTDYTEIGLLWHNVGKKTAVWLPAIAVPQVIILAVIANVIF
jgi:hypothetical protein